MNPAKRNATIVVIALCVCAVLAFRALRPDSAQAMKKRLAERAQGSEKAPLWITECPGQIYLQVRYFPLSAHKNAMKAAVYAECASRQPGKFWKFHDRVFEHQPEWAMDPYPQIRFAEYARSADLDVRRLDACAHDETVEKAVADEKKKGEELGVKITPTFFVNGKIAVGVNGLSEALQASPVQVQLGAEESRP
jgi:predicted DsbA family dithiol-disulfide isomerase